MILARDGLRAVALLTGCDAATRGSVMGNSTDSVPGEASPHAVAGHCNNKAGLIRTFGIQ